jgi:hypothetical protein
MATYRNKNFTKRDYEATNIVACEAEKAPEGAQWEQAPASVLHGLQQIFTVKGVRYYGYL